MSKEIKNSVTLAPEPPKEAIEVLEPKLFSPQPVHRRAKTKFWARVGDLPTEPSTLTVAQITSLIQEPSLAKWWRIPDFKEWFLNRDEARERLEYLFMIWTDKAEQLILNDEANHNAIVQLGKIIATLANKMPQAGGEKFTDADIQKMGKEQLRTYIEKMVAAGRYIQAAEAKKEDDK